MPNEIQNLAKQVADLRSLVVKKILGNDVTTNYGLVFYQSGVLTAPYGFTNNGVSIAINGTTNAETGHQQGLLVAVSASVDADVPYASVGPYDYILAQKQAGVYGITAKLSQGTSGGSLNLFNLVNIDRSITLATEGGGTPFAQVISTSGTGKLTPTAMTLSGGSLDVTVSMATPLAVGGVTTIDTSRNATVVNITSTGYFNQAYPGAVPAVSATNQSRIYTDAVGILRVSQNGAAYVALVGAGTVTSVALTAPAQFAVTGSPVTSAGTLAIAWNNQTANTVLAGPASGGAAAPTFRALVMADMPVGIGTVTSVGVTLSGLSALFSASGSPVTSSGSITLTQATTLANLVYAGPASGGAAGATFRSLVAADISSCLTAGTGISIAGATITNTGVLNYYLGIQASTFSGTTGALATFSNGIYVYDSGGYYKGMIPLV